MPLLSACAQQRVLPVLKHAPILPDHAEYRVGTRSKKHLRVERVIEKTKSSTDGILNNT